MQIRVSPEAEIQGLDVPEFGVLCYPDFVLASHADRSRHGCTLGVSAPSRRHGDRHGRWTS